MDLLLMFVIACIIVTITLIKLIFFVTNKSASVAITSYFLAAEYILEYHQPPMTWIYPPISLSRRLLGLGKKKSSPDPAYLLFKMDDLILFFEHSSFFQDEEARTALLQQLNDERDSWVQRKFA